MQTVDQLMEVSTFRSILRNHLTNKFTGFDGISAQILKECDEELSYQEWIRDFSQERCTMFYFNTRISVIRKPHVILGRGAHPQHPLPRPTLAYPLKSLVDKCQPCFAKDVVENY